MSTDKQKKVYVVPHSHWDREWYFTIEDSNVLLVENIDYLMDVLENDNEYHGYVFDAQMSIVDEYLKIRPEQRERFQKLVAAKRIFVGPWYTQADTLLVNKESVIRNLLYGTRMANEMGHSMNIGYLPDIFGQNMYLPSMFEGFGIDYSILQRGIYTDQLNGDLNFTWKSPDGKTVKANNIYFGYGPGKFLDTDSSYVEERLLPLLETLGEMNGNTDNLLLPAGGDQVLVRDHFPETVKKLNEINSTNDYILSDFETFMEETWEKDGESFKNEIEGELIASQKSRIHNTIRSQRYDLKKLNYDVENKILYVLEPLAVLGKSFGLKYPQTWLDQMWKQLFDVHAHDSIGGCNSDDTNRDIIVRLEKVDRIANGLINILKKQMTRAISKQVGQDNILVLFNTNVKRFNGLMESVIFTKEKGFTVETTNGDALEYTVRDQEYLSGGKQIVVTADGEKEVEVPGYYRTEIAIKTSHVPPMGYATFVIVENENEKRGQTPLWSTSNSTSISNEFYAVSFNNGTLSLENKVSGGTISDLLRFENVGDAGDSYDFSPLDGDNPIYVEQLELVSVEKAALIERLKVKATLNLPADLDERENKLATSTMEIITSLELRKDEELVRVQHEIDNTCEDQRIRVLLNTSLTGVEHSYADQAFSIIERPVVNPYLANWRENKFAEAPVPMYPLENFAAVTDGNQTFATITKGIKEYEVLADSNELALTLFRSVGLLGKDNLAWRPGRASGINNKVIYTPDAQLKKNMTFEYAISFADGSIQADKLFSLTDHYIGHYATYQKQSLNTFEERLERFELPQPLATIPATASLFSITNEEVFVSTCKLAYEGDGVVVRLFNPTGNIQNVALRTVQFKKQELVNLYEEVQQELDGEIVIPSKGYITIKLT
ncbi:alpha-mannosidase [Sutcliffiella horikoshii]|uniref:glycoside hydrolase family 38 N-terminal domain-containing protein n=1 Tax=Sutcliffiella horikoshii TaxID=79883 RepID=UPI00203D38A1|nr:glycoside hydrolase family 38 C-terminal domain-containing protein [Sutcliffiella horikoshii]MCM3620149.1 alpha-mannosidase [Sutcliffiella horikoshii]